MKLAAPAKLNLSLRVLGRRDDGFHEIDSIMVQLPGLADTLVIERADEDDLACDDSGVPTGTDNLVWRAAAVWREASGCGDPLRVRLEKRIPHGAGLGGGSSDAAAMLRGMNALFGDPLDAESLVSLAAQVGSDVAFFLGSPVGRVSGRGEKLSPGPKLGSLPVVLLKPGFGVSTPAAYRAWKEAKKISAIDYGVQRLEQLEMINDLERPVFAKHRFLAEVKRWLGLQPEVRAGFMSGSGSTMFGVLHSLEDAEGLIQRAKRELDPNFWSWSGQTADGGGL